MFGMDKKRKQDLETIEDVLAIGIRVRELKEELESVIVRQKELELLFARFNETLRSTQDKKLDAENKLHSRINEIYMLASQREQENCMLKRELDEYKHKKKVKK